MEIMIIFKTRTKTQPIHMAKMLKGIYALKMIKKSYTFKRYRPFEYKMCIAYESKSNKK